MDILTGVRAAQGIASIGSLFSKGTDTARDNRRQTIKLQRESPSALRQGAEAAGFNPLTVLGSGVASAGVGGATAGTPPLASFAATLGDIADGISYNRSVTNDAERLRQSAEAQYERVQKEQQRAGGAAPAIRQTLAVEDMGGTNNEGLGLRPLARGLWSQGATPIVRADGSLNQIPTKLASRLQIEPWGVWTAGDAEEMYGDEAGQVVNAPRIPGTIQQTEGGISGYGVEQRKKELARNTGVGIDTFLGGNVEITPPTIQSRPEPGWMDEFFK